MGHCRRCRHCLRCRCCCHAPLPSLPSRSCCTVHCRPSQSPLHCHRAVALRCCRPPLVGEPPSSTPRSIAVVAVALPSHRPSLSIIDAVALPLRRSVAVVADPPPPAFADPFIGWLLCCFPPSAFVIACCHATIDTLVAGPFFCQSLSTAATATTVVKLTVVH